MTDWVVRVWDFLLPSSTLINFMRHDVFFGDCPTCHAELRIETKATSPRNRKGQWLKQGDYVSLLPKSMNLLLRFQCSSCQSPVVASIKKGRFLGFSDVKPSHKEVQYGRIESCS